MADISPRRDPEDDGEWQDAVNYAHAFSLLESARMYGLVRGGPEVDLARCDEILERGRQRGVFPQQGSVDAIIQHLAAGGARG